jgi:hypothetical protein
VLLPLIVNTHRADRVVQAELNPVDPAGQEIQRGVVAPGQILQRALACLDHFARDLALGDTHRLGHLGEGLPVRPGRDAYGGDLEHPIG